MAADSPHPAASFNLERNPRGARGEFKRTTKLRGQQNRSAANPVVARFNQACLPSGVASKTKGIIDF
jgi:hypothetical protein